MKRHLIAYISVICAVLLFATSCKKKTVVVDKPQTDWALYELQGKVAVINEQMYNMLTDEVSQRKLYFDTTGMLVNRSFYEGNQLVRQIVYTDSMRYQLDADNMVEWITIVKRDSAGQIIEEYSESEMGSWTTTYNYTADRLLAMETTLSPEGELMSATHYSYNADKRLEQQIEVGADGQVGLMTNYTYYNSGLLHKVEQFDGDGLLQQAQIYTYDSDGNQVEEIYTNGSGVTFYSSRTKYENGMPTERLCTGSNIYNQKYTYTYKDGHRATETIVESEVRDGQEVMLIKTLRTCDMFGNWVEEKIFEADANYNLIPTMVTNRILEYYESRII